LESQKKLKPTDAAMRFIEEYYPTCYAAVLAGSIVRGEGTESSDLDIVIFDEHVEFSFRENFYKHDWRIELFVHNLTSYRFFFEDDCKRGRPSLPNMVSEGIVLKDNGVLGKIRDEANQLLLAGPVRWDNETAKLKRYFLTDLVEDFIGSTNRAESIFIANSLADLTHEFVLRMNGQWVGSSKWIFRALRKYDPEFAKRFVAAFDLFYRTDRKQEVVKLVDEVLEPYGGRLFDGFTLGK